ncbi:MAG: hypothetical protein ACREH5_07260 [Candidatus Omnitrophota bacterium]
MRTFLLYCAASLAIHAVIAAPAYGPFLGKGEEAGTVLISYVAPAGAVSPQKRSVRAHIPGKEARGGFFSKKKAVPESSELLTDPQMGKVFHGYFVRLKERIHQVIRRHSDEHPGGGTVSLVFILRSDGALDSISVAEKESSAGSQMKAFAMDCVKASVPFDPFPKELDPQKIAFRVTIHFHESAP